MVLFTLTFDSLENGDIREDFLKKTCLILFSIINYFERKPNWSEYYDDYLQNKKIPYTKRLYSCLNKLDIPDNRVTMLKSFKEFYEAFASQSDVLFLADSYFLRAEQIACLIRETEKENQQTTTQPPQPNSKFIPAREDKYPLLRKSHAIKKGSTVHQKEPSHTYECNLM